jgi:hypothetical protein
MDKKDLEVGSKVRVSYEVLSTEIIGIATILELLPTKAVVNLNGGKYETNYKNIIEKVKRPEDCIKERAPEKIYQGSGERTLKGLKAVP